MPILVLASISPFRRELLSRLQIAFEVAAPTTQENALPNEPPKTTAERLAEAKARSLVQRFPDGLIIGSDQVAFAGNKIFGKPGTRENAVTQLRQMRGKEICFHTGLCLLNARTGSGQLSGVSSLVAFRELTNTEIAAYLHREDALNCAGSAKSEGLGISLLNYIRGDDPNALIGLPLISLCQMLRNEGVCIP